MYLILQIVEDKISQIYIIEIIYYKSDFSLNQIYNTYLLIK